MAFQSSQLSDRSLKIIVCGAGTMGSGIAQLCAQQGYSTVLYDIAPGYIEKAAAAIGAQLLQLEQKQKISPADRTAILQRLQFTADLNQCVGDLVIEAVIETPAAKVSLFNQLAELNHSDTVFASNTSSLSVTALAKEIQHPERVAGLHFFNPATLMKLVEVVETAYTPASLIQSLCAFAASLGKTPVVCTDAPGFIVNHVARPFYIESLYLTERFQLPLATTDQLLEATGFRMGPFRLMDLIGNDINYAVSCSVYDQLGQPERLKPSPLQEEKVMKGELGKKTGQGYYSYSK